MPMRVRPRVPSPLLGDIEEMKKAITVEQPTAPKTPDNAKADLQKK